MKLLLLFYTIISLVNLCYQNPSLDYDDSLDKIAEEIFVTAQKSGNVKGFMDRVMDNLDVFLTLFQGKSSVSTTGKPTSQTNNVTATTIRTSSPTSGKNLNFLTSHEQNSTISVNRLLPQGINRPKQKKLLEDIEVDPHEKYQLENNDIVKAIKTLNGDIFDNPDIETSLRGNFSVNDVIKVLFGHDPQVVPFPNTDRPTTEDIFSRLKNSLENRLINIEYGERNLGTVTKKSTYDVYNGERNLGTITKKSSNDVYLERNLVTVTKKTINEGYLERNLGTVTKKSTNDEYLERNLGTFTKNTTNDGTDKPVKFEEKILQLLEIDGTDKDATDGNYVTCYCFPISKCAPTYEEPVTVERTTTSTTEETTVTTEITTTTTTERTTVTVPCVPTTCPSLD